MGNFSNNAITDVGKMMLADVQAGAVFTPTRIVIGSGSMSGGATAQGMTDVITPVVSIAINKKKRTPDGKCIFGGVYSNAEVTEPFYFRELALYAKAVYHNEDGSVKSEGEETLYSYGNAGTTADYMPAYSTSTVVEKQIDLVTWVGNDAQVDLTIDSGVYLTRKQGVVNLEYINPDTVGFDSLLEYMVSIYEENIIVSGHISGFSDMPEGVTIMHGTINVVGGQLTVSGSARTAHYFRGTNSLTEWTSEWRKAYDTGNKPTLEELGAAPGGYGLGSYPQKEVSLSELDSIFDTGWYILSQFGTNLSGVGFNYANVLVHCTANKSCVQELRILGSNIVLRRYAHLNEWDEWEVENPPFDLDVEYRTTEHRNGKAVYKKLGSDGVLKYRLDGDTVWHPYAQENGAVKRTGDTITGDLAINKSKGPTLHLSEGSGSAAGVQIWNDTLLLSSRSSAADQTNYRLLSIANSKAESDVARAIGVSDVVNGVPKYYTVLHSGNLHLYGLGAVPASVE